MSSKQKGQSANVIKMGMRNQNRIDRIRFLSTNVRKGCVARFFRMDSTIQNDARATQIEQVGVGADIVGMGEACEIHSDLSTQKIRILRSSRVGSSNRPYCFVGPFRIDRVDSYNGAKVATTDSFIRINCAPQLLFAWLWLQRKNASTTWRFHRRERLR